MYCVKCGVELADTEKQCPLCKTRVYHPDLQQGEGEPLYPKEKFPAKEHRSKLPQALATAAFLLPMAIAVIGGLALSTVLSLLFVPSLFSLIHGGQSRIGGWLGRHMGLNRAAG